MTIILWVTLTLTMSAATVNTLERQLPPPFQDEWCHGFKNEICGSDGITHWNQCLFERSKEKNPDLVEVAQSACDIPDCSECHNEPSNYIVCTSSNVKLNSSCMLECYKEEFPLIKEDPFGCVSGWVQPSVKEMEVASATFIIRIVEEFLGKTLDQTAPYTSKTIQLNTFQGQLINDATYYKVLAKRGWIDNIVSFQSPDTFTLSTKSSGRMRFRLGTASITAGYKKFLIMSGKNKTRTALAININNGTIELVADLTARGECTRLIPVALFIPDMPSVEIHINSPLPDDLPHSEMEGFMKEEFLIKINEAIETSLLRYMQRVGCISWLDSGLAPCFGAFQQRFCSAPKSAQKEPQNLSNNNTSVTSTTVQPEEAETSETAATPTTLIEPASEEPISAPATEE